jgi:hypothetical protein
MLTIINTATVGNIEIMELTDKFLAKKKYVQK